MAGRAVARAVRGVPTSRRAEGCRGWEACWGCVRIAAGTAEVGLLKVSVAAIASLWKERCAQDVSIHQPGAAVC